MGCWFEFKRERTFFFEANREHIQVTKSKLAPLQRRSVLDDLVLSLKSLKSSCLFHIPRANVRCWAEFKRRMINFWITFWSIISELTMTVLLKGKYLKNIFFLKRRSFPFHTLKRRTTNVKFCVGLLKPKENMFELVKQPWFEFQKLLCCHYTFLEQEWDVDLNLKGKWYIFGRCFSQLFEKQFEEHYLISNDTQFHSTILTEEPQMSNYVL